MGTAQGLLLLVRAGRPWFMSSVSTARIQPTTVTLRGDSDRSYQLADLAMNIVMTGH